MGDIMALSIYAAINIASQELSLKIYELSKARGIRELSHVRHKIALSSEIYQGGTISYSTIEELCTVLNDFKRLMDEWKPESCQVYSTGSLRDARNSLVVLDQIKVQTGFRVKVLSNSETRFLYYKALALKDPVFNTAIKKGTLIVDIGAGRVQLSIFNESKLCATQSLLLGASRIHELLLEMQEEAYDFHALIDEYMEKDLVAFRDFYLDSTEISSIIAVGEMIPEIYYSLKDSREDFEGKLPKKILKRGILSGSQLSDSRKFITPTLLLCRKISALTNCEDIYLSDTDLCDSMAAEYADKKLRLHASHDFTEDILSSSRTIARKYMVDMQHVENIQNLALQIFDRIRKLHGLGKRERLLLQIATILHSCGSYIDSIQSRECSYRIIMSTEIIGLSHTERAMVANMVRYNSGPFPSAPELEDDFTKEEYITIVKLNAILRTANVLDKSNRHKIKNVGVSLRDGTLVITADTMEDITLEKGLFHRKADIFQDVFGIRPMLKQKRSGKNG